MLSTPPLIGQPRSEGACARTTASTARQQITKAGRVSRTFRRSMSELVRDDLVLERLGIEAVEAAVDGLRLRVHEEGQRTALRLRQHDVVGEVERDPVHLPRAE